LLFFLIALEIFERFSVLLTLELTDLAFFIDMPDELSDESEVTGDEAADECAESEEVETVSDEVDLRCLASIELAFVSLSSLNLLGLLRRSKYFSSLNNLNEFL